MPETQPLPTSVTVLVLQSILQVLVIIGVLLPFALKFLQAASASKRSNAQQFLIGLAQTFVGDAQKTVDDLKDIFKDGQWTPERGQKLKAAGIEYMKRMGAREIAVMMHAAVDERGRPMTPEDYLAKLIEAQVQAARGAAIAPGTTVQRVPSVRPPPVEASARPTQE